MGTLPKHGAAEATSTAAPEQVWAVLADVTRTGEWSHETVGAEWIDGSTDAVAGARFRGRNEQGRRRRWTRVCEVVEADAPRRLRFRTVPTRWFRDSSMWTFDLEPVDGGTRIRQRFDVLRINPLLDRFFHATMPAHRDRTAALRQDLERLAAVAAGERTQRRTDVR
jgi:uncharacterized protein YndB with AHSA1/START domain